MKIVFGFKFEDENTLKKIGEIFKDNGIDAQLIQKNLKGSIEEYLFSNSDVDVLIFDEYIESTKPYQPEEITHLVDLYENVMFIPVINESHKGDTYIRQLYNTGVMNAVYSGTPVDEYAGLIKNPRKRLAAKLYYGISSEEEISERERNNIPRLVEYVKQKSGTDDSLVEAVAYIRKRISDTDFAVFCDRLPDNYISVLWDRGLYTAFIGHRITNDKKKPAVNINIGGISIKGQDKEKIVYREVGNEIIAVISPRRKSGSTFVAVNLAKQIADLTGLVTGYVHLPDGGRTYSTLNLKKHIPGFISCLQEIMDDKVMSRNVNVTGRVSVICENPDKDVLDGWDYTHTTRVLYQSPNPAVLDIGAEKPEKAVVTECTSVVVVIDDGCGIDELVKFRNDVISEFAQNTKVYYVFNRFADEALMGELEQYVDGTGSCFAIKECRVKPNRLFVDEHELAALAKQMGYDEGASGTNVVSAIAGKIKETMRRFSEKRPVNISTVEIAVGSVARGSGCTHTAVMIASLLARRYRVAYLAADDSGHIACLDEQIDREIIAGDIKGFPHAGVDYYHDVAYAEFASQVKDRYDFIVVDYGINVDREEYLRAGKRIVTMAVADYRMKEIDGFREDVLERIDRGGSVMLCVPFKSNRELAQVRKLCRGNTVYAVPFCSNPFYPDAQAREFVERIVGIRL